MVGETARNVVTKTIHDHARQTLGLPHWAVFVGQEQALEADDFFPQLGNLA
jgi:hypothetical protein